MGVKQKVAAKKAKGKPLTPYEELEGKRKQGSDGRKRFATDEALAAACDEFFDKCKEEGEIPTVSGLAYHLDMTTAAVRNYAKRGHLRTISRAKQRIEMFLEQRLQSSSPTGTIFNLKNNFGWRDQLAVTGADDGPVQVSNVTRTVIDVSDA